MNGYLWLADESGKATMPGQFRQSLASGRNGQLISGDVPNLGNAGTQQWVGFRLGNNRPEPVSMIVELDFIAGDDIEFYVWHRDSLVRKVENVSWKTPSMQRDLSHRVPAFRVVLQPGQTYDVALAVTQKVGYLIFPVLVHEEHYFGDYATAVNLTHGITAGFLLLAVLVGITFWLMAGERIYVYYGIYVIGIGGFVLEEQGYFNQYLLGHFDVLAGQVAWPVFSQLAVIGHTLFAIHFLRLGEMRKYRLWVWFGWTVCGCSGVLVVLLLGGLPFDDLTYHLSLSLSFVYILLSFGYLLLAVRQKHRESHLYIVAVSPLFLAIVYAVGATIDLLPQGWLLFAIISYSPAWEITWLFAGLVRRFSFAQQQRITALEETAQLQMGMVKAIDAAQESERQRVGRDLHDDIGTTLVVTKAKLGVVTKDPSAKRQYPELGEITSLIDQAIADLRNISHNLMPVEFEEYALADVVQQAIERANNENIQFEFISKGEHHLFSPDRSRVIYRMISELINNIIKHSQASTAVVQMLYLPDQLVISVEDDGIGLEQANTASAKEGIGIKNVTSRANYIGARLDISSNDEGTCTNIEIPYD